MGNGGNGGGGGDGYVTCAQHNLVFVGHQQLPCVDTEVVSTQQNASVQSMVGHPSEQLPQQFSPSESVWSDEHH